jgi:hypothetical protein
LNLKLSEASAQYRSVREAGALGPVRVKERLASVVVTVKSKSWIEATRRVRARAEKQRRLFHDSRGGRSDAVTPIPETRTV